MAKAPKYPFIGVVKLDVFDVEVPVYLSDDDRVAALKNCGVQAEPYDGAYHGLTTINQADCGLLFFSLVIPIDSEDATWVHEASHLADFIMETLGMDPGPGNTETRAYVTAHIFRQISNILDAHLEIQRKKALAAQKRQEKRVKKLADGIGATLDYSQTLQ